MPTCKPSVGEDNPGQPWPLGKVRTGRICPEKAPLKVPYRQSAESILGGFFGTATDRGWGSAPNARLRGSARPTRSFCTDRHLQGATRPTQKQPRGKGELKLPRRANSSAQLLSCPHVLTLQVVKVLGRALPSSLSHPRSTPCPSGRCGWLERNPHFQALFAKGKIPCRNCVPES